MPGIARLRTAAAATCAIASMAWLGGVASAFADEPQPGRTSTTQCTFVVKPTPARTACQIRTTVISAARCQVSDTQRFLVWDYTYLFRAVDYAGNVVTGQPVDGYYTQVRANAKMTSDSGDHVYLTAQVFGGSC